ncbi:centriole, cilia and spindle-associated protein-like [Mustela erminea]|uniref:centriole, cilia and spindle-associated protein-like n=1 Tax=Mustela erminea TaxID=36723 RepID=UPI001386C92C|nr:centriole, cilia and spindle-associated protein-like [Mustela erminea]
MTSTLAVVSTGELGEDVGGQGETHFWTGATSVFPGGGGGEYSSRRRAPCPGSRVKSEYTKRQRASTRSANGSRAGRRTGRATASCSATAWAASCGSRRTCSGSLATVAWPETRTTRRREPGAPRPRAPLALQPAEPAARERPERRARGPAEERGAEAAEAEEARDAEGADEAVAALPAPPVKDIKEKPEQEIRTKETEKFPNSPEPRQQPSALFARGNRKAVKSPQRSSSKRKENKHPFALYGWGEKQTDTGIQKTHHVCASAPVQEIHESALRAKNRRQVEKRKLVTQRQRAHSVEVEKNRRIKPPRSENPWVTEYRRCYSARGLKAATAAGTASSKKRQQKKEAAEQKKNHQRKTDTGLRNQR